MDVNEVVFCCISAIDILGHISQYTPVQETTMNGLTDRQLEVLRFIARQIDEAGYPPTIREIGEALDIRSTNGVNDHLKALEKKGFLARDPVKSRALIPTPQAREVLSGDGRRHSNVVPFVKLLQLNCDKVQHHITHTVMHFQE